MDRRGFICAGCWTVDRIKQIEVWPAEEELARIELVERQGGGSAHNVGIDLRRLDGEMPVAAIGMVGKDEDGDFLYAQAAAHAIDTTQLHRCDELSTSYTDVMSVGASGKRTFFHYPGANDLLLPEHFDFSAADKRILHLGLLSVHAGLDKADQSDGNGWATILRCAQSAGLKTSIEMVSIDPVRNRELVLPCLPYIDYLVVNDHEIGSIAQCKTLNNGVTDIDQCKKAAKQVLAIGGMDLVVVHYPDGAICIARSGETLVTQSLSVPQSLIKSSVGAGDAFVSGFLYGMHEQWSLSESLELAHIVAACSLRSVTTIGAVESIASCREFTQSLVADA